MCDGVSGTCLTALDSFVTALHAALRLTCPCTSHVVFRWRGRALCISELSLSSQAPASLSAWKDLSLCFPSSLSYPFCSSRNQSAVRRIKPEHPS